MRWIGSVVTAMSVAPESSELATISVRMVSSAGPTYASRRSSSRCRRSTRVSPTGTAQAPRGRGTVGQRSRRRSRQSRRRGAATRPPVRREQRVLEEIALGAAAADAHEPVDRGLQKANGPVIVAAREGAECLGDDGQRAARGEPSLVIGDPQLGDPALEGLPLARRRVGDRAVRVREADPDPRERARGERRDFLPVIGADAAPPPARCARAVTHNRPARASPATAPRRAGCSRGRSPTRDRAGRAPARRAPGATTDGSEAGPRADIRAAMRRRRRRRPASSPRSYRTCAHACAACALRGDSASDRSTSGAPAAHPRASVSAKPCAPRNHQSSPYAPASGSSSAASASFRSCRPLNPISPYTPVAGESTIASRGNSTRCSAIAASARTASPSTAMASASTCPRSRAVAPATSSRARAAASRASATRACNCKLRARPI